MEKSPELRGAQVAKIRDELRDLWASEALSGESTIRAQTHNLVIYYENGETVNQIVERVIQVTTERPGRVIVVSADPTGAPRIDSWVTSFCRMVNRKQVCGELIMLLVGGHYRDEVHSAVNALLSPDLPVYLWWGAVPDPGDHLFSRLMSEADRLIIDTDDFDESFPVMASSATLSQLKISDLNWARLTPWRRLLAQIWDSVDRRSDLEHCQSVDVHYVSSQALNKDGRALLMVGWLAERLGWDLISAERLETGLISYWRTKAEDETPTKIELMKVQHSAAESGELMGIFIQAGVEPPYLMPRIALQPEQEQLEVRFNDASPFAVRQAYSYKRVNRADALAEELDLGYDPYYQRALAKTMEILRITGS